MSGLAGLAVGTAPIAGGALLTMAAGKFKAPVPDFRGPIKQDQELLQRIRPSRQRGGPNCSAPSTCGSMT